MYSQPMWLENLELLENTAVAFYKSNQQEEALSRYTELAKKYNNLSTKYQNSINYNDKFANILAQKGRCHKYLEEKTEAIEVFNKALQYQPARLDICYELAFFHYQCGNTTAAKKLMKEILQYDIKKYSSLNIQGAASTKELIEDCNLLLGNIAMEENSLDKAKKYYQASLCYIKLTELAFVQQNYTEAISCATKTIANDTSIDKKISHAAYYYWGMSLILPHKNATSLTDKAKLDIIVAVKLLGKIGTDVKALHNLACLYDEEKYGIKDSEKALVLYQEAAEKKHPDSLHNLAYKYDNGEGVELNKQLAFDNYLSAAKLNFAFSQTDLARCYLTGNGCEIDYSKAKHWAEKAADTIPLAKHYLACILAHEFKLNPQVELGEKIIQLFSVAAEADVVAANLNLAIIYETGAVTEKNFELAEYYYREAIRLRSEQARDNLLLMYFNRLQQIHVEDKEYETLKSACRELLLDKYETSIPSITSELIKFIKQLKLEHYNHIEINKKLTSIYENKYFTAEEKVPLVLEALSVSKTNTINLATTMLKLGALLDQCINGHNVFRLHLKQIEQILILCELNIKQFSERGVCNLITGISKLYRHGYNEKFDTILKKLDKHFANSYIANQRETTILNIKSILPAATRTPLQKNLLANTLQACIYTLLNRFDIYSKNNEDLSNVLYCLAILDNYKCHFKEFNLTIDHNLIKFTIAYAIEIINKKNLARDYLDNSHHLEEGKKEKQQYFFTALYFGNFYPNLIEDSLQFDLKLQAQDLKIFSKNIRSSKLQTKIYNYLKVNLAVDIKEEFEVNTLPVDFLHKRNIIQIHGPHHYIYINIEQHELSAKDNLHNTLLNCICLNSFRKTLHNISKYKIIIIDYLEYEKAGNSYLNSELSKNGLYLVSQNRAAFNSNKKFFKKDSESQDYQILSLKKP